MILEVHRPNSGLLEYYQIDVGKDNVFTHVLKDGMCHLYVNGDYFVSAPDANCFRLVPQKRGQPITEISSEQGQGTQEPERWVRKGSIYGKVIGKSYGELKIKGRRKYFWADQDDVVNVTSENQELRRGDSCIDKNDHTLCRFLGEDESGNFRIRTGERKETFSSKSDIRKVSRWDLVKVDQKLIMWGDIVKRKNETQKHWRVEDTPLPLELNAEVTVGPRLVYLVDRKGRREEDKPENIIVTDLEELPDPAEAKVWDDDLTRVYRYIDHKFKSSDEETQKQLRELFPEVLNDPKIEVLRKENPNKD
jgi:hypothetical protein